MSELKVDPEQFSKAVIGLLDDYGDDVIAEVRKAVDATARDLVKETKQTAPRKTIGGRPAGTFANHISSKVGRDTPFVYSKLWYVKPPEYRLTHLLNNGHALRQGGRWEGTGFLTKASKTHSVNFEKRLKEGIRHAGR